MKNLKSKKLNLTRETVRALDNTTLPAIAGGASVAQATGCCRSQVQANCTVTGKSII